MGPKLQNAVDLYIQGLRDGHLSAALDKYVTEALIQHTPGIAHGRDGLLKAYAPLINRHYRRTVHPMRGFEDESLVFLHTFATYGWREIEHVTLDIFDTDDDDHIVEHWGVRTPLRGRFTSGYSQIDGARWVTDTHLTQDNKDLVEAYVTGADPDACVARTGYVDHGADPVSGRYAELRVLMGSGNFVATAGRIATPDGAGLVACDLYRVEAGLIVEHWDAVSDLRSVRDPGDRLR
jgi:predicted SnoaL-like aldol condensation-catalyzing enzyme